MALGDFRKEAISRSNSGWPEYAARLAMTHLGDRRQELFSNPDAVLSHVPALTGAIDEMGWPQTPRAVRELADSLDLDEDSRDDVIKFCGPWVEALVSRGWSSTKDRLLEASSIVAKDITTKPYFYFYDGYNTKGPENVAANRLRSGPIPASHQWYVEAEWVLSGTFRGSGLPQTVHGAMLIREDCRSAMNNSGSHRVTLDNMLDRALIAAYESIDTPESKTAALVMKQACFYAEPPTGALDRVSDNIHLAKSASAAVRAAGVGYEALPIARSATRMLHDHGIPSTVDEVQELRRVACEHAESTLGKMAQVHGYDEPLEIDQEELMRGVDAALQVGVMSLTSPDTPWSNVYTEARAQAARTMLVEASGFNALRKLSDPHTELVNMARDKTYEASRDMEFGV